MADQAGDSFHDSKLSYFDHDASLVTDDDSREFKFSYPLLMEAQIRKLKHSMEPWRGLALAAKSLFLWEKQWHPSALVGASTVLFTLLWLIDPSILTVASLAGLAITLADYFLASMGFWFKAEKWNAQQEKEFDDLCTDLILCKTRLELATASYYKMRTTNRKMYFMITVTLLLLLAWIGCSFNNLFLSYAFVTFALLYPGLEHHGMITKGTGTLKNYFTDILNKGQYKKD